MLNLAEYLDADGVLELQKQNLSQVPDEVRSFADHIRVLNVSDNPIKQLPDWIGELTGLEGLLCWRTEISELPSGIQLLERLLHLDLTFNHFTELPEVIRPLTSSLQQLYFQGNLNRVFPDWLWDMSNLTGLSIGDSPLSGTPDGIARLKLLRNLSMTGHDTWHLVTPPDWLAELSDLEELYLGNHHIKNLPDGFGQSMRLRLLNLWKNGFSTIPNEVLELINLHYLNMSRNVITSVPPEISRLAQLQDLVLGNNQLADLPASLTDLRLLKALNLDSNPFHSIPDVVFRLTNLKRLQISDWNLSPVSPELAQLPHLETLAIRVADQNRLPILRAEFDRVAKTTVAENGWVLVVDLRNVPVPIPQPNDSSPSRLTRETDLSIILANPAAVRLTLQGRRIAVAGTGTPQIPELERVAAQLVGKVLADAGCILVCGTWPGVDEAVASAFLDSLSAAKTGFGKQESFDAARVVQFATAYDNPAFNLPGVLTVPVTSNETKYSSFTGAADALIIIGGVAGTHSVFRAATAQDKPVLPFVWASAVDSSARRAHDELISSGKLAWLPQPEVLLAGPNPTPYDPLSELALERYAPALEGALAAAAGASPLSAPRFWVVVVGNTLESSAATRLSAAAELGRALAHERIGIIVREGAAVAQRVAQAHRSLKVGPGSAEAFIRSIDGPGNADDFIRTIPKAEWPRGDRDAYQSSASSVQKYDAVLDAAAAIIVIGGSEGTRAFVSEGVRRKVPIVPIAGTGGAAEEIESSLKLSIEQGLERKTSREAKTGKPRTSRPRRSGGGYLA